MDIHEHDMFIFLSAGDKAVDVELVGSTGSSKKMKVEANQKRIFHRLDQTVKIDKDSWSPYTARSQLGVCLCTTEKKIFHPGERVHIILYVARSGGKEVEVEITHMEQPLLRKSTKLDASGASIIPLDDLENGPYKVSLFGPRIERESCEFIVAPFTLSPLQTIVEKQSVQNDKITVTAKVMKLNIPYSGPIRVDVRCSYCNGTVVESKNLTVTKGKLTATYSMGGHTGPFTLDFVTPDGSTSTEFLEGTRTEDRQELDLNKIGTLTKCALLSHENAENVRNLFFWESGSSTWPLVLQQAIEKEVQLQALEDLAAVACVQVDPIEPAEYQVHEYIDVKKGTTLRFPNKAPYSLVRCGVFTKKGIAYQGSVACIYPDTIDAKVKAPEQSSPGDEIEVEIAVQVRGQEREPVKCLLMIMDSRIERNKDDIRAGKQLFAHLRQEQSPWNNGEVESRESIRKRREEEERRRAEEDRRRTAAGPPRLFQRAVGGTGDDGSPEAEPAELDLDAAPPQPKKYAMKEKSKPSPAAAPPSRAMPVMASINVISAVAAPGPAPVPPSTTTPGQAAPSKVSQIPSKAGTSQLQDVLLEIPEASIVTALRQEEQVILVGLLDVTPGRALKTKVMLGEQVCTWRVEAIFFRGVDIAVSKVYIEAKLEQFVEVHVPSFLEPKDKCSALVTYQVTGPAVIRAETYQNVQEFKVDGQGVLQLPLTGPTEVIVELERGGSVIDRVQKSVAKIGTEKVTVSQISQGQPGQVFEGDQVLVYPSPGFMLVEGMKALVQYPYGCAEQTSCKMCGLITAWKAGDQGAVPLSPADVQDIKDKLVIGINRMGLFFRETAKGGEFSLWENGTPSPDVSAKVLKNLAKLRDVDLPEAVPLKQMLEKAAHSLIEAKVKNADLLEYNPAFGPGEIECVEDAARYLLAPDPKFHAPAIEYLKEHVEETDTSVSWEGKRSWCGAVEATCYALAGLVRSGAASPYIDKGLAFIGKHMINGRLHSTSDTVAMLEFFAELAKQQGPGKSDAKVKRVAVIDGKEVVLDKVPVSGKKVELKATAFVRVDKRSTIDYTQASSAFKFDVKLSSTNLVLGDRAQVTITPKESSICPIAHVYLPGNVAAIESGTNIQLIVSPLKQESLALDVIAVRTGTCQMRVLLRDMYDEEKLGCTLPMKVTVNAPKQ